MKHTLLATTLGLTLYGAVAPAATLTLQEGVGGYTDTFTLAVFSARPTTAFTSQNTPLNTLTIDGATADYGLASPTGIAQGLIRFDNLFGAGGIPGGATINSATLRFFTEGSTGNTPNTVALHRMTVNWNGSTTWNGLVNGVTLGTDALSVADSAHSVPTTNAFTTFDVTTSVRAWAAGTSANFGWAILNSGSDGWDFTTERNATLARRPQLVIDYTPAVVTAPVPLPPAAWLLASALGMLAVSRRTQARRRPGTEG